MEPAPSDPTPPADSSADSSCATTAGCGRPCLWIKVISAGILAGLVAGAVGELCVSAFEPPRHAVNSRGIVLRVTDRREEAATDAKNAGLAFTILGAAVGAAMGAAGGLVGGTCRSTVRAAVLGLVLGAIGSAGASAVLLPAFNSFKLRNPDAASSGLMIPLLIHAGICATAGAAAGLAFGRGLGIRGVPGQLIIAGLVGAALGASASDLIGALLYPAADTTRFIPENQQIRVLANLAVAFFVAIGLALAVGGSQPSSKSSGA